uniref:Gustatory receptor n=1 Tax=Plectus sambesii TaxID=2011161 RepID=A0A914WDE1_9BILA
MTSVRIRWLMKPHHMFQISIYLIFVLCMFLNVYVLLSRDDTIYYLRIYHAIVGGLMIACSVVMIEFLYRMRNLPKLDEPHEIPLPALVGAIALTIGIDIGYMYLMIFNFAFSNCDKLIDALYGSELYLDCLNSVLTIVFCTLSLVYIMQRRFYGAINTNLDKVGRLWVNATFAVMWIKIVVYKGYLSHQELCQRQELEGYWCPVIKRHYECDPSNDLKGTQKIWYYMNKGMLNGAIISCAAEFFPVLIIAHWLACGGAEEKAEDILRRKRKKQGVRGLMQEFMRDISRVYTANPNANVPPLEIRQITKVAFNILAFVTTVFMIARWVVFFYYSIDFDHLIAAHWGWSDGVQLPANVLQFSLFLATYLWGRSVSSDRLDAHHKAHARGDIITLFGCCVVLFVKLVLQAVELEFQSSDGYIYRSEAIVRTISLVLVQVRSFGIFRRLRWAPVGA